MSDLCERALDFAMEAHRGQVRKYTDEPYIYHPMAVAKIVSTVEHTEEMYAAALLHDTVEDCDVTIDQITDLFGLSVAEYVADLTDVSTPDMGNRKVRKEIDRQHSAKALPESQTIKLADLIHNSASITTYDKKFSKVFMAEKKALLEVLTEGDPQLHRIASNIVKDYESKI